MASPTLADIVARAIDSANSIPTGDEFGSPEHSDAYKEENKGPRIMTVAVIMSTLTTFFVVGRIYSRFLTSRKLAIDDYLIVFSMSLAWAYIGLSVTAINYGGGRHADILAPEDLTNAIFFIVVSFVPGVLSFIVPKFAVVILIVKLLNPGRIHRYIMWFLSVTYGLHGIGMLCLNFAQCTPAAAQWDISLRVTGNECIERSITVNYSLSLGVYSAILDFYLALYPTIILLGLQMKMQKKIALAVALGFGFCAGAVTIYKCTTLPGLISLMDFTFAVDDVVLWTNIEACCVIIGACIPTMAPLAKQLFGGSFLGGSTNKYYGGAKGQSSKNPNHDLVTIGSSGFRDKMRAKNNATRLDSEDGNDHDSRDIILEEREVTVTYAERQNKERDQGGAGKTNGSGRTGTSDGEYGPRITEPNW